MYVKIHASTGVFSQHQDALFLEVNIGLILDQYLPRSWVHVWLPSTQVDSCLMSAACFLSVLLKLPHSPKEVWRFVLFWTPICSLLSVQTRELYDISGSSIVVIATQIVPEAYRNLNGKRWMTIYCEWPEYSWGQWFKGISFREIWCRSIYNSNTW